MAVELSKAKSLAHFELDLIAWQPTTPPIRRPIAESKREIETFVANNEGWVIEGCYTDLLELLVPLATEIVFLNLPTASCITNAKKRLWEPHKYESKQSQDDNLSMLLDWIAQYDERTDTFSRSAHQELFDAYQGKKTIYTSNDRD